MSESLNCKHLGICGGCAWGELSLNDQRRRKLDTVTSLFPNAQILSTPQTGLRDRVDLIWEKSASGMNLGLFALNERKIVAIEHCPMMSPALESFFAAFKKLVPPIQKGSVRLRVSPNGERGAWLDFANQDVKTLFEERIYLQQLSQLCFVEIGQRRKALTWIEGRPKLIDPILKPWFQTFDQLQNPIPLYGPVGGFTQAGFKMNQVLVNTVMNEIEQSQLMQWVELFSGNGNFSLAMAARKLSVQAVELDALAVQGINLSLESNPELKSNLEILKLDVYAKANLLPTLSNRGLLVDPPRSGLREILHLLRNSATLPRHIVYVSCFTESFVKDALELKELGYKIISLKGIDQFAQTPHIEWVASFSGV